ALGGALLGAGIGAIANGGRGAAIGAGAGAFTGAVAGGARAQGAGHQAWWDAFNYCMSTPPPAPPPPAWGVPAQQWRCSLIAVTLRRHNLEARIATKTNWSIYAGRADRRRRPAP